MTYHPILAPFTPEQVEGLNRFQRQELTHPFTCPEGHILIARRESWVCPCCDYTQNWAHNFMVLTGPTDRIK